jgi:hypothetical protein
MRFPRICLDDRLAKYLQQFEHCFSRPQYRHFVTMLLGLLLCQGSHTLSGVLRQVTGQTSLAALSRFLSEAPWSIEEVCECLAAVFRSEMVAAVRAERVVPAQQRRGRRGRRRQAVVTGYLIGDDSVTTKPRGRTMGGLGQHYSTSAQKSVDGHCLVQALYVLLGRQWVLEPQMYVQRAVCAAEGTPFRSKVDIMVQTIQTFVPLPDTTTHVLLDSWYTAKRVWQAARQRGFLITSGLRSNRLVHVVDPTSPQGWSWQRVDAYAQQLTAADFEPVVWPGSGRTLSIHTLTTRVRKLYRCQVVVVRDPLRNQTRFWASSDLNADVPTLVAHIAQRWAIEVLFADVKELLGLDHYQLMSAQAIRRFWLLALIAYSFLEREREHLRLDQNRHVTIGEAARYTQRRHWERCLSWLQEQFAVHHVPLSDLQALLLA